MEYCCDVHVRDFSMSLFFFFDCPATTCIYTYCHTLSRHDSLPSWATRACAAGVSGRAPAGGSPRFRQPRRLTKSGAGVESLADRRRVLDAALVPLRVRSEEHTSELQSLMRTSYAVFCLNKKK